jgi:uncharacterized protein (TIGR03083 family)
MKPVEAIDCVTLFPPLSRELLAVLKTLTENDWEQPTICADWSVKDVAAHLLGGNLGRLRNRTDPTPPEAPHKQNYDDLLHQIDRNNALWVEAARRISPEIMIEFLALTDGHLYNYFKSLPQDGLARITVAWASDDLPPNWFDIAREYSEKWLHQQHIREAVGQPLLTGRAWLHPVLDTFLRGLPRAYRNVQVEDGLRVAIYITGEAGGEWSLVRKDFSWQLFFGSEPGASCQVVIDQDIAWRLFSKGVSADDARPQVHISGEMTLGEPLLKMVSIMA